VEVTYSSLFISLGQNCKTLSGNENELGVKMLILVITETGSQILSANTFTSTTASHGPVCWHFNSGGRLKVLWKQNIKSICLLKTF